MEGAVSCVNTARRNHRFPPDREIIAGVDTLSDTPHRSARHHRCPTWGPLGPRNLCRLGTIRSTPTPPRSRLDAVNDVPLGPRSEASRRDCLRCRSKDLPYARSPHKHAYGAFQVGAYAATAYVGHFPRPGSVTTCRWWYPKAPNPIECWCCKTKLSSIDGDIGGGRRRDHHTCR